MSYRLNQKAMTSDLTFKTYITLIPKEMVRRFGPPLFIDGEHGEPEITGAYTFENDAGEHFRVYDWHQTSLYDKDKLAREVFWVLEYPVQLKVSAKNNATDFVIWLIQKVFCE